MQFANKILCVILLAISTLVVSCGSKKDKSHFKSPPGYNLLKPVTIHLKSEMDEISGIQYYPKDTSVFAVIDEAGYLYKIHLRKRIHIRKWKFSRKADFEDIVLIDSTFYALNSNGTITGFKFVSGDSLETNTYEPPFKGKNEFESLYYDTARRKLILLCKDCEADKKKSLSAYAFDPAARSYIDTPVYVMDVKLIAGQLGLDNMKFKPSAAGIHPISRQLYIISSVNKAIVIANLDGNVIQAYNLNPRKFKQPEGLNFTPKGDLLISNEAAEAGPPNLLIFKYKARIDEKN